MDTYDALQEQQQRAALQRLRRREWVVLAVFLVLALLVAVNIKRVEVKGQSMEPTCFSGDTVIVWKTAPRGGLKSGDVIVFKSTDGDELIKRIVFITRPGPAAQLPPPGFPSVVRTPTGPIDPGYGFDPYFVAANAGLKPMPSPQDTIYVMGDNYKKSNDSRDFGPISVSQILGKVLH